MRRRIDKRGPAGPAGGWTGRLVLRLVLLTGLAVSTVVAQARATGGGPLNWRGTVIHVTDGDSLWVRPQHGGMPRAIRLDGIDAPELCQSHGEAARSALVGQVLGRAVQVRVRHHDDYGRALARVRIQGRDVGEWLVREGHAWSYRYRGHPGPYAVLERQAREQRRGLFSEPGAQRPREFRRRHGPCG